MNRPSLPTVFFGHGHRALPGLVALATDIAGHRDHHGRRGQPSRGHWAGLARGWLRPAILPLGQRRLAAARPATQRKPPPRQRCAKQNTVVQTWGRPRREPPALPSTIGSWSSQMTHRSVTGRRFLAGTPNSRESEVYVMSIRPLCTRCPTEDTNDEPREAR